MTFYRGTPASEGYAVGPVYRYVPFDDTIPESFTAPENAPQEQERYGAAREAAAQELAQLAQTLRETDPVQAEIFTAHAEILDDEELDAAVQEAIESGHTAPSAVYQACTAFAQMLAAVPDAMIAARAADVKDVRSRLIRLLLGVKTSSLSQLPGPVVVVAQELLPSDTATMDRSNVLALLTRAGGTTSHCAILARSFGIPAVVGMEGILTDLPEGETVLVDAVAGTVCAAPDAQTLADFLQRQQQLQAQREEDAVYLPHPCRTADGVPVSIGMNIGALNSAARALLPCCDMAGLFRTEFVYMDASHMPTEEEQFRVYRDTLLAFGGKPVTLRTLDIGGDKSLPYFPLPSEENPFLGNRALRLCLSHREIFLTQLRAALRASVYGDLWLMFPMVGSLADIHRALDAVDEAKASLAAQGIPFAPCKIGIMVEIPAIALLAREAAQLVDFASIGTNDLCQYLSAADRHNPQVEACYDEALPAVLRMIAHVAQAFGDKPLSVCGELGGDKRLAPVLVGMGLRKLSMSASRMAAVKRSLSRYTLAQCQAAAQRALACSSAEEILAGL